MGSVCKRHLGSTRDKACRGKGRSCRRLGCWRLKKRLQCRELALTLPESRQSNEPRRLEDLRASTTPRLKFRTGIHPLRARFHCPLNGEPRLYRMAVLCLNVICRAFFVTVLHENPRSFGGGAVATPGIS